MEIADLVSADACEFLSTLIDNNSKFHKLYTI